MTTTISAPISLEHTPIDEQPPSSVCTAGHKWCDGECHDKVQVDPGDEPVPDYHRGVVAYLHALRFTREGWRDLSDVTLIVRLDEAEEDAKPLIMFDYPHRDCGVGMTAGQARINAAWLLNAADLLDPLPTGATVTTAVNVRIGDEMLTSDGWQKVTGLLFDATFEQASVFTAERNIEDSDGWDLSFNDPVKVRRALHGSRVLPFEEPIPGAVAR